MKSIFVQASKRTTSLNDLTNETQIGNSSKLTSQSCIRMIFSLFLLKKIECELYLYWGWLSFYMIKHIYFSADDTIERNEFRAIMQLLGIVKHSYWSHHHPYWLKQSTWLGRHAHMCPVDVHPALNSYDTCLHIIMGSSNHQNVPWNFIAD